MSASVPTLFTETTLDGFPLWVVLLICGGVFLAGFMDAIAGGGGIISVPVYLMAFSGLPTHFVLGTNKLSSCIGTAFSTGRLRLRDPAAASHAGCGAEVSAAGGAAGGGLLHPADQNVAGGAGPHPAPAAGGHRLGRRAAHRDV